MGRKYILGLDLGTTLGSCPLYLDGGMDAQTHKLESSIVGRTVGVAGSTSAMRNLNALAFALRRLSLDSSPACDQTGARRTSVSDAAKHIPRLGIIDYSRGMIGFLSKEKLGACACERVDHIRDHYQQAFHPFKETE